MKRAGLRPSSNFFIKDDFQCNLFSFFSRNESRDLPVLWHQSLLTFVQRYKGHISSEQKEALLELLKHQIHDKITPEIRRELLHAKCRDEEMDEPMLDTME